MDCLDKTEKDKRTYHIASLGTYALLVGQLSNVLSRQETGEQQGRDNSGNN